MNHETAQSLFTEYHDGELDDQQCKALEAHLASCETCAAEWKAYQLAMGEISGLLQVSAPRDVTHLVEKNIHRRSRGKFFGKQSNTQYAVVSFILVLLFLLAYLMLTAVNEIVLLDEQHDISSEQSNETGTAKP